LDYTDDLLGCELIDVAGLTAGLTAGRRHCSGYA
jgi:hypothetical protein